MWYLRAMERKPYPTDLTDRQWMLIEPLIPPEKPGGRHRSVDLREVLNAIFYLLRSGCQWRNLPHDLPPWGTVSYYFYRFARDGTWQRMHDALRTQVRLAAGRAASASVMVIDSQSVKTTEKGASEVLTRRREPKAANAI